MASAKNYAQGQFFGPLSVSVGGRHLAPVSISLRVQRTQTCRVSTWTTKRAQNDGPISQNRDYRIV